MSSAELYKFQINWFQLSQLNSIYLKAWIAEFHKRNEM